MDSKGFQIIEGFIKLGFLVLISLGLIIYVFIKNGGQQILNDWQSHKDNPMIMPFAGALGKNTESNAQGVFFTSFKTNFSFLMQPVQYIMTIITDILGKLMNSMNLFRAIMKPIRQFFTQATQSFYDKINEFSIMIVYFFSKMRNLLRRLSSTFRLLLYTLQAIHLTIKSVWNGPIGEVSRDWAYAYDVITGFFCLHGDTEIKLRDGRTCPIKQLNIGDKIYHCDGEDTVIGMAVTKITNTDFYRLGKHKLTKSHLVLSNGKWVRAETVGTPVFISGENYVYCPITTSHTVTLADGQLVKDFTEIDNLEIENKVVNYILSKLNRTPENQKSIYTSKLLQGEPGLSETSYLNLPDGKQIQAKDVKIGTQLELGKVLGLVKFKLTNRTTYQINNKLQITARQFIKYPEREHWSLIKDGHVIDNSQQYYYSFFTSSGYYRAGNILLTDILDGMSTQDIDYLDNLVEKQVNMA